MNIIGVNLIKIESAPLLILAATIVFAGMVMTEKIDGQVVCFGDSITHGAKVDGHSWVYLLAMDHKGIDFVNEGRNGRKTSDREQIIPVLKKHGDAGVFIIFLGVNDLKDGNDSAVYNCVANMKWMIDEVRKTNRARKIVILAPCEINVRTMSPLNVRKKYNENTERCLVKLERKYRELARKESVGFISLLKVVSPRNFVDGLHPNHAGQQQIADAVWKGLSSLFK